MSEAAAIGLMGMSYLGSSLTNRQSYRYSKKLMAYQNQLNLQNWKMQNEYNLPINEKNRWLSAGINPYFGIGTNQAGSIASPSAQMQAEAPDFVGAYSAGMQASQIKAQTENIKEDTRGKQIQNDITEKYGALSAEADYKKTLEEVNNLVKEGKYKEAQTLTENVLRAPRVANLNSSTELNYATADKSRVETNLLEPYYDLEKRKVDLTESQYAEIKRHNIAVEHLQQQLNDAQVYALHAKADYDKILGAIQNYLWSTGRIATQYDTQAALIASTIANNKDVMLKRGIDPKHVLGNLLNGVLGDSTNFVSGLLQGLSDSNISNLGDVLEVISNPNQRKGLSNGLSVGEVKKREDGKKKAVNKFRNSVNNYKSKKRAEKMPTLPHGSTTY